MTVEVLDLVLLPQCDLHMTVDSTARPLRVQVKERSWNDQDPDNLILGDVTSAAQFTFFAPFADVGHRLDNLPHVTNGEIIATTPGLYLFQVRHKNRYLVGRLQVHPSMEGWWFGAPSITTTLASAVAYAQPTIYARFTPDATGTDVAGDITGHGFVKLTSATPAVVSVDATTGRLHGHSVTPGDTSVKLTGAALGSTAQMDVRVVDMQINRPAVVPVRGAPDAAHADKKFNILFLAEGFTAAEEARFNEIVLKTTEKIFDQSRHEPYQMLKPEFNVFRSFQPSRQPGVALGWRSIAADVFTQKPGTPFPIENMKEAVKAKRYIIRDLTRLVGLPRRGESRDRATLVALWKTQSVFGAPGSATVLDEPRLDDEVIAKWKAQQVGGLFDTPDTFFGIILGQRPGDRNSGEGPVDPPATDDPSDAKLHPFIRRVYEFFTVGPGRGMALDPRRHPPTRTIANQGSIGKAMAVFLGGLQTADVKHHPIGQQWVPGAKSGGLVVVIANEVFIGGSNFAQQLIASTMGDQKYVDFTRPDGGNPFRWLRTPLATTPAADSLADTCAHEFGHSFNLGDEYETEDGDGDESNLDTDLTSDNLTRLGWIYLHGTASGGKVTFTDRQIRPDRVKWLDLPRPELAARTIGPSAPIAGGIKVTISKQGIDAWTAAQKANRHPSILAPTTRAGRQQLPLPAAAAQYATGLTIARVTEATGVVELTGGTLPGGASFPEGSALLLPRLTGVQPVLMATEKVRQFLAANHNPLNLDLDHVHLSRVADYPQSISGFKPPCKSYKLIGVYEGGQYHAGAHYRPAGACKMRSGYTSSTPEYDPERGNGEFCHVCKWLIVNFVDPGQHGVLDTLYPKAKKNG